MARRIGCFLSHQSDRQLPQTYFPFGVTAGTKLSGHEYQGVLLVVLIMCVMEESPLLFLSKMSVLVLHQWTRLLELLLGWWYWLKKFFHPTSRSRAIPTGNTEVDDDVQEHCKTKTWEWFQVSQASPSLSFFGEHGGLGRYRKCGLRAT